MTKLLNRPTMSDSTSIHCAQPLRLLFDQYQGLHTRLLLYIFDQMVQRGADQNFVFYSVQSFNTIFFNTVSSLSSYRFTLLSLVAHMTYYSLEGDQDLHNQYNRQNFVLYNEENQDPRHKNVVIVYKHLLSKGVCFLPKEEINLVKILDKKISYRTDDHITRFAYPSQLSWLLHHRFYRQHSKNVLRLSRIFSKFSNK